jgi:peroxiredoxin
MSILPALLFLTFLGSDRSISLGKASPPNPLFDSRGGIHRLSELRGQPGAVVFFFATGCPLGRLYAPRINTLAHELQPQGFAFVGVASQPTDSLADLDGFVRTHHISFPVWKDRDGSLAAALGVRRTPEVMLFNREGRLCYRGRVDDQFQPGLTRAAATNHDLRDALDDLLAGRAIRKPLTEPAGCLLGRSERYPKSDEVVYTRHIARILQQNCQACHRPGQIGPFPLTTFEEAASWGPMIREVVQAGRMPPWHASPAHGKFANDRRLSEDDKLRITTWVDNGCPEGDRAALPPPAAFPDEWSIPTPDFVLSMPNPFNVPAQGEVEYQYIEVDPGFTEDRWIQAAEVLPGCRAVVHHCNVLLKPPTRKPVDHSTEAEWTFLTGVTPGKPATLLPEGVAKRWPAGWRAVFVIHYSPNGSPQVDQTRLGLVFADPAKVHKEIYTHLTADVALAIPPRVSDYQVTHKFICPDDMLLYGIFPHMHVRGKSFLTEAEYPDGRREILLDVPHYDFAWQHQYILAEPLRLPAGTVLRYTVVYDNSRENLANPNPDVWVHTGPQSWDEMFNAYVDIALANRDVQVDARRLLLKRAGLGVVLAGCVPLLLWRWRKARRVEAGLHH